jgi:hypothetical protein
MAPRAALGLVPLLALTLAGCVTTSEPLGSNLLPGAGGALAFLDDVAMEQDSFGAEPNMAILPDGTIFITAVAGSQERPNAMTGTSWLWRSPDGGETWETLRSPVRETPLGTLPMTRRPFGSSDADVVTSPDGWVYYSDWWNWGSPVAVGGRYGSYLVERSNDGGNTWESSPVTTLDSLGGIDRQWLVAKDGGYVGLFYAYFHGQQNTLATLGDLHGRGSFVMSIQMVRSNDHGATWSSPITVVEPIPDRAYQIAHPTVLADGTLAMPYADVGPGTDFWNSPGTVRVMLSRNDGTTWFPRTVAAVPEGFDNLWAVQGAADAQGNLFVAWAARTGPTMTVFVSRSSDQGATWTEPFALRAAGLNFLPWVAARGDGQAAVGWYGGDAQGDPLEAPEDHPWFAYAAETRDGGATWSLARVSEEPVKLGPLCPRGAACGANNRELLDYVSLAYDPEGRLHYGFARSQELDGAKAGFVHYAGEVLG